MVYNISILFYCREQRRLLWKRIVNFTRRTQLYSQQASTCRCLLSLGILVKLLTSELEQEGYAFCKCRTHKTLSHTVSVQVQSGRQQSQPGHNPPGSKCHTGAQAQLSISQAITQALNATQGHKRSFLSNKLLLIYLRYTSFIT